MSTLVDLTHTMDFRTPRSTDHPEVRFPVLRHPAIHGQTTHSIEASLHAGTHVDAPCMYFPEKESVDQIPLERLYGPGVVLDVRREEWGIITSEDLENATPEVREGDIVVLYIGWGKYFGVDEQTYMLKQPGLDKSAVDWLVSKKVNFVCADVPSCEHIFSRLARWKVLRPEIFGDINPDPAQFPPSYAHRTFFENNIFMVDHLGGDVEKVAGKRCTISIGLAKYGGVEAAPARVIAILD